MNLARVQLAATDMTPDVRTAFNEALRAFSAYRSSFSDKDRAASYFAMNRFSRAANMPGAKAIEMLADMFN